jgi:glutamyl/glutaminyl-tRNA synthetase
MKTGFVTRFNPTTNGPMHLGHVYIALFNEHTAHTNNGKFLVRFEDNQPNWVNIYGGRKGREYAMQCLDTLDWLGISVDDFAFQSDMDEQIFDIARSRHIPIPRYVWPYPFPLNPTRAHDSPPFEGWYGYTPFYTFCKVICDNIQGVTSLIRGDDLRAEYSLYMYFSEMLGMEQIMHYYMPRLQQYDGSELAKHMGSHPVSEYRKSGASPSAIIDLLSQSSLKVPADGWYLGNVRKEPKLVEEFASLS